MHYLCTYCSGDILSQFLPSVSSPQAFIPVNMNPSLSSLAENPDSNVVQGFFWTHGLSPPLLSLLSFLMFPCLVALVSVSISYTSGSGAPSLPAPLLPLPINLFIRESAFPTSLYLTRVSPHLTMYFTEQTHFRYFSKI